MSTGEASAAQVSKRDLGSKYPSTTIGVGCFLRLVLGFMGHGSKRFFLSRLKCQWVSFLLRLGILFLGIAIVPGDSELSESGRFPQRVDQRCEVLCRNICSTSEANTILGISWIQCTLVILGHAKTFRELTQKLGCSRSF